MFCNISEKITNKFAQKKLFKDEEKEIYVFGLNQIFTYITNILTILILGIIFNEIFESMVYTMSFMALRTYAGGYHATTPKKCYLLTVVMILTVLTIIKYFNINILLCLIAIFISGMIILLLSPVGCENKVLDSVEQVIYKKKVYLVWGIEMCVVVALLLLDCKTLLQSVMFTHFTLCIALVIETIREKKRKERTIIL